MDGTVFVVTSGKGGVGKTTTALNLAVALRASDHSVALVDADLGMANLATMLGVTHEPTLHDVLAGDADLDAAIAEEVEGFAIVPGGRDLAKYAAADPDGLPAVIESLRENYEYVIVDAGAGLSYENVMPIEVADEVLLVTTPGDASVGDTTKIAEFAKLIDGSLRGAVITRATESTDPAAIGEELGVEPLVVVPEDAALTESAAAGTPIERYAPDSPGAAAYRRLAAVITEESVSSPPVPDVGGDESTAEAATVSEDDSGATDDEANEGDGGDEPTETAPETATVDGGTEEADTDEKPDTDEETRSGDGANTRDETADEGTAGDEERGQGETSEEEDGPETTGETVEEQDDEDESSGGILARIRGLF